MPALFRTVVDVAFTEAISDGFGFTIVETLACASGVSRKEKLFAPTARPSVTCSCAIAAVLVSFSCDARNKCGESI